MRGEIQNRQRAQQLRDFSGMRYGNITPTDIDGFIDFGNKVFVFIETKYGDAEFPYGQRLALERLCDASHNGGVASWAIVTRHDTPVENDIDLANTRVCEFRERGQWHTVSTAPTCKEFVDWIYNNSVKH